MREVEATEAQMFLDPLLNDVERCETIVIIRHGRPIARLVPEADHRRADILATMERLAAFRKSMPSISTEEALAARHEGHDAWFRAKVREALDDGRPPLGHGQIMADARAVIDRKRPDNPN